MTKARDISKLSAVEVNATGDQTDAEVKAAVEAASDSNTFTDADHSKLNAIEASADVTDATNVTAAGALMDSELTNLAAVKAINQSLVTTADAAFASLTIPSDIIHAGDADTLLQFNAADSWRVITGDEERLKVSNGEVIINDNSVDMDFRVESNGNTHALFVQGSSGNVGIGTSSPDGQLHLFTSDASITPDADADDFIIEANGAAGITIGSSASSVGSIRFADSGSPRAGMIYYDHVGNAMRFYTLASERMRIDSSGNMGIGTTSPDAPLELEGNNSSTTQFSGYGGLRIHNANGSAHNVTAEMYFTAGTSSSNRGAAIGSQFTSGASGNDLYFATNGGNVSSTNTLTERMRIDSSGNVGIGTASPDNPLEVVGADSGIKISSGSSNRPHLRFECGSDEKLRLSANTAYGAIGDGSDANRYMAFKNGNVGIGTTNPEFPLHVFKATGNLAKITTSDDNNGATNPLHIAYNASLRVDNEWSGAGPSAHGTKVAKIQLGTVTTSGYGAYGAIILDSYGTGYDTAEMSFATGSNSSSLMTERMRIASNGRQTYNKSSTANGHANFVGEVGSSSKAIMFEHTNGGGECGKIITTSNTAVLSNTSDYRLKENVNYTWDATTRLKQLKPARFNWINDETNTPVDGFLAHEVSSIVPSAVYGEKDGVDEHGNPDWQSIAVTELVPLLVKTIQELEARITALEA